MFGSILLVMMMGAECGAPGPAAISPCIVPMGHFQIEGDMVGITFDRSNEGKQQNTRFGPFVFKAPLNERSQVEAILAPYQMSRRRSTTNGILRDESGPNALTVRLKHSLVATRGLSVALHPGIRTPLTNTSRDNTDWLLGMPTAISLGNRWSLTVNPEIGARTGGGKLRFRNLVGVSRPIDSEWILVAEIDSSLDRDRDQQWQHVMIVGGDYTHTNRPNLHIDIGMGVGLSESAPDLLAYLGFSKRL